MVVIHKNKKSILGVLTKNTTQLIPSSSVYEKITFQKSLLQKMMTIRKRTRKIKNNTLAIAAAPAAIFVNPKIAAIIAIIKKIAAI